MALPGFSAILHLMRALTALYAIIFSAVALPAGGRTETTPGVLADVVRVHDGDTIVVDAYPWPGMTLRIRVRVRGIDSPEIRGACEAETRAAGRARERVAELVSNGVRLENITLGKYAGRVIADAVTSAGTLGAILISEGLARPYDGGRRSGWCD